jgi:subtilisin family serine protease
MLAMLLAALGLPTSAAASPQATIDPPTSRLLVRLEPLAWAEVVAVLDGDDVVSISAVSGLRDAYRVEHVDPAAAALHLERLQQQPSLVWAEPDALATYAFVPDDVLYSDQSWADALDLPAAWEITTGSPAAVVAVVDSGVSASHPDLAGALLPGYDFLNNDTEPEDDVGHGTAVAGIIAARGDDRVGIAGVAMSAMILPVKVGSASGAPVSAIAAGVVWAVDQGVEVINLSLVTDQPSNALREAVQYAYERDIPVITAAGNDPKGVSYPGAYDHTISVGASTLWGTLTAFTSRENRVDLVAPGASVMATWWSPSGGDGWTTVTGTSFAAPMVSGAIALLRSVNGDLTVEETRQLLRSTALAIDEGQPVPGAGAGLLDAGAALQALLGRSFEATWGPVDRPVSIGLADRTWLWGPAPFATGFEEYDQSEHGTRLVRYFDKARMEITDPASDGADPWYVTNGLLTMELITGRVQVGDDRFLQRSPAEIVVAGDLNDPEAPTYADFEALLEHPAGGSSLPIMARLDADGMLSDDPTLALYGVINAWFVPETGHEIASVFWEYLNAQGPVLVNEQLVYGPLFNPTFFATGLPITEPYWMWVSVGGIRQDVLVQCFERRCLTYTPANAPQWRVEMGNVGQHYYQWRYNGGGTIVKSPPDESSYAQHHYKPTYDRSKRRAYP